MKKPLSINSVAFHASAAAAASAEAVAKFRANVGEPANDNNLPVIATPFEWQEPATIAPREFLHAGHYLRGFLTATAAPGGVGKSANSIVEALAMITGRPLPLRGMSNPQKYRVWLVNGEDSAEEMQRRIQATMLHFGIRPEEIEGRLFVDSGHDQNFIIGREDGKGIAIAIPVVSSVIANIEANEIDCLILDPWISFSQVDENSNSKVQAVVTQLAKIAKQTNASVELVAHSRKANGKETTADDTRGASALHDKTRSLRTINRMTKDEGDRAGLAPGEFESIVRIDSGKHNVTKGGQLSQWRRLVSVPLGNGDEIGVIDGFYWPDSAALADAVSPEMLADVKRALIGLVGRESNRSPDWAGFILLDIIGGDPNNKADKARAASLLTEWIKAGHLAVQDGEHPSGRRVTKYIVST